MTTWRVCLLLLCVPACVSERIAGRDRAETSWHGRLESELGAGRHDPGPRRFRHGLEFAATGVDGVVPDRGSGAGIDDYRLFQASGAWKPTLHLGAAASVCGLAGLAYEDYQLHLGGGTTVADTVDERDLGDLVGAEVRAGWESAGAYGRFTQVLHHTTTSQIAEVGLELRLHDKLSVQVAYRWWELEGDDVAGDQFVFRDVELDVEGLTIGGVLRF